jgi:predicted TIM-barrel fold metal-dependent hydrolase
MKKIALEEHYGKSEIMRLRTEWLRRDGIPMNLSPSVVEKMEFLAGDIEQRLQEMDKNEIAYQILIPGSNGTEGILDKNEALEICKRHNESVAEVVSQYPTRFKAYAALPLQAPELAAKELERCLKEYEGFVGSYLSGYVYKTGLIDEPQFSPIFEAAEKLGVVFYITQLMDLFGT